MNPHRELTFSLSEPAGHRLRRRPFDGGESMFYIMPDTCIWIDFLIKAELRAPLAALERLVRWGDIALLTTDEILEEFRRDEEKKLRLAGTEKEVLLGYMRNLQGHDNVELARGAALVLADSKRYRRSDLVAEALTHVRDLQDRAIVIPDSDGVRMRVLERIRNEKAPFHNTDKTVPMRMNDAMIIEKFAGWTGPGPAPQYVFVSTNRTDYALPTDADEPHEDFADVFGPDRQFTKHMDRVVQLIDRIVADGENSRPSRILHRQSWVNIQDQLDLSSERKWYHEHLARERLVADGTHKLVPGRTYTQPGRPVRIGMVSREEDLDKARRLLLENPDFATDGARDVGFVAGAVTALKWVLGQGRAPFRVATREWSADAVPPTG